MPEVNENIENKKNHSSRNLANWFYLPEGRVSLIRRLTAVTLIPSLFWIWRACQGLDGPYRIPTWRFGDFLFELPVPEGVILNSIFIVTMLASTALIFGARQKFLVVIPTFVLIYFTSCDLAALRPHYVTMAIIFMVALSFHKEGGPSITRRIIQLGIASCYGFASIQRLFASDHLSGLSFKYTVGSGWACNDLFKGFFQNLYSVDWLWAPITLAVLSLELFLTFGFFFRKTRKIALILGLLLHISIAITMTPFLAFYSLIMITGYLAFFEGRNIVENNESENVDFAQRKEMIPGLVFIALMFIIPLRSYFWLDRDRSLVTMIDRDPWSFHMFLYRYQTKEVTIKYQDKEGNWIMVPPVGRMVTTAGDNDIHALIGYLFKSKPEAKACLVDAKIMQNDLLIHKVARASRENGCKVTIEVERGKTHSSVD